MAYRVVLEMTTIVRWLLVADFCSGPKGSGSVREEVFAEGQVSPYDPSVIESIVFDALGQVRRRMSGQPKEKMPVAMQLSLRPILSGESRPSFGLSVEALCALASMSVSIDFDPY
ncbi:hypothetical protein [Dokdonella ginsengisoli]|uniref:Uncharacterized protein n=1 Tax=Dokdonella ginsengisoli TaxID=363846 RepID=A0ABV9QNH3_9GAMM